MVNVTQKLLGIGLALAVVAAAYAAIGPGQPAPDFALQALDGKQWKLSDLRGKYVVLEWFNSECPFVQKHYESGNMQNLQAKYTAKGVIWLGINSTSPKHSNYRDPARSQSILAGWKSSPSAFMLDPDGKVGTAYGARTTPHMYVVDPKGTLVYVGGIDDKPSTSLRDVPGANNYVAAALDELLAGRKVSNANTRPYGCSVKYAD